MSSVSSNPNAFDDHFKKSLKVSAVLHIALILFFSVRFYFFPSEPLISQTSLRVDLVALPQKQNESRVPEPEAEVKSKDLPSKPVAAPAPEKIEGPTVDLSKKKKTADAKKKQQEAINKLKQMSALESLQKEALEEKNKKQKAQVFAGNQISKGSDLKGLSRLQHDNYVELVEKKIRTNWALPQWMANKKFRAVVRVKLDTSGRVLSKDLIRSSGNSSFDDVVLETVDKSSPFPKPPDKFARLLEAEGIQFGFPD